MHPRQPSQDSEALAQRAADCISRGQPELAKGIYLGMIERGIRDVRVLANLGVIYGNEGNHRDAAHFLAQAASLDPQNPRTLVNLGWAHLQSGDVASATDDLLRALEIDSSQPSAWLYLAHSYLIQNQILEAITAYTALLVIDPDSSDALRGLSRARARAGDHEAALQHLATLAESHVPRLEDWTVVSRILIEAGHLVPALAVLDHAARFFPASIDLQEKRAFHLRNLGKINDALDTFFFVLALCPEKPDIRYAHACCNLLIGNYAEGLQGYESRRRLSSYCLPLQPVCSELKNTSESCRHLLLMAEQGLGDTLHFSRYCKVLASRLGSEVTLCAPDRLHSLLTYSAIADHVVSPANLELLSYDKWLPLLSAPLLLDVSPENPIVAKPYLQVPSSRIDHWRSRIRSGLNSSKDLVIAINWQGSQTPEAAGARGRSIPLEELKPLADIPDVCLVSLQKGYGAEQLSSCSFLSAFVDCQAEIESVPCFVETAAIILAADLVITTDTATAHLSGALGQQTWLLTKYVPEWRWGMSGSTSFWYSTVRLYRQTRLGAWDDVIQRIVSELAARDGIS